VENYITWTLRRFISNTEVFGLMAYERTICQNLKNIQFFILVDSLEMFTVEFQ